MQHLRIVLFQLAFLALTINGFGQTNKLKLGGEGGINMANMWVDGENQKFKLGGQLGFFTQISVNERVSFKTGLYLEQKGARFNLQLINNNGSIGYESKALLALNYLTLPVLVRADFGQKVRFYLNGGPYIGVLLKAHQSDDGTGNAVNNTDRFKKTELGLTGGVGFSFPVAKDYDLSFEVRDYLGITNIYKGYGGNKMRTNTIQLLVGVSYRLSGVN